MDISYDDSICHFKAADNEPCLIFGPEYLQILAQSSCLTRFFIHDKPIYPQNAALEHFGPAKLAGPQHLPVGNDFLLWAKAQWT